MRDDERRPDRQSGTPETDHHFVTPVVREQPAKASPSSPRREPSSEDDRDRRSDP